MLLLLYPLFNQVSLIEIKISFTRETWAKMDGSTQSHHKTQDKVNASAIVIIH